MNLSFTGKHFPSYRQWQLTCPLTSGMSKSTLSKTQIDLCNKELLGKISHTGIPISLKKFWLRKSNTQTLPLRHLPQWFLPLGFTPTELKSLQTLLVITIFSISTELNFCPPKRIEIQFLLGATHTLLLWFAFTLRRRKAAFAMTIPLHF